MESLVLSTEAERVSIVGERTSCPTGHSGSNRGGTNEEMIWDLEPPRQAQDGLSPLMTQSLTSLGDLYPPRAIAWRSRSVPKYRRVIPRCFAAAVALPSQ